MLGLVNIYSVKYIYNSIIKCAFMRIRICKVYKNTTSLSTEVYFFNRVLNLDFFCHLASF